MYIQPDSIQDSSKAATAKKDLIQAVGFILTGLAGTFAGVAAGVGIYFTWRNLKHAQTSSRHTLQLTERGQVTERFT